MRVLITGINGHIGSTVAKYLIENGYEVVGVGRSKCLIDEVSEYIIGDISDINLRKKLVTAIKPCSAIVHAAALLNKNLNDAMISLTNCLGTQQILSLALDWKCKSLVYVSGVQVIGIPKQKIITEKHPVNPLTAYHASKLYGEHLMEIAQKNGLNAVSLRVTSPVGVGMSQNRILPIFVSKAIKGESITLLGEGTRYQNYVDARDVALAIEICIKSMKSGLFNIGGKTGISNVLLAEKCISILNSTSKILFSDNIDLEEGIIWNVSIKKSERELKYKPKYSIDDIIKELGDKYENSFY